MSIASFAIKRPVLIVSVMIIVLLSGYVSLRSLGVDMYPDVEFPFVVVTTIYPGAGPEEIEEQISKPLEEEIATIAGIKTVFSRSTEGFSIVWAEFSLSTDPKYAESQVKDKVDRVKNDFPDGTEQPYVERWDMSRDPIITLALSSDMSDVELYDYAKETIKPMLEQVADVGTVNISGGTRREILIELDREKLDEYKIPAILAAERVRMNGMNIPVGKVDKGSSETVFKTVSKFRSLDQIRKSLIFFSGDAQNSITLDTLGEVKDTAETQKTKAMLYDSKTKKGEKCIILSVYKQSGTNTVKVADGIIKKVKQINEMNAKENRAAISVIHDSSHYIRVSVADVAFSIIIGIILAVIVVYLFLGNVRSTIITGVALPNSLLGGFILMMVMGFTVNIMTLLALSLTVGLLVDDAIVVRENIFRKIEEGLPPALASKRGTEEVMMAVIATTITIIAVFFPIAFMSGIVGRFFKEFGLSVVFIMLISLCDALTVAPMLSAYISGKRHARQNFIVASFDRFQLWLERGYTSIANFAVDNPGKVILVAVIFFAVSIVSVGSLKKGFIPPVDGDEFKITFELPADTSLNGSWEFTQNIQKELAKYPEIKLFTAVAGTNENESNIIEMSVSLTEKKQRKLSNTEVKKRIREMLNMKYANAHPIMEEYSIGGDGGKAVGVRISGDDLGEMEEYSKKLLAAMKSLDSLTDVSSNYKSGKPEFQIKFNQEKMHLYGITPGSAGSELRTQVEGADVGKFYDGGFEYNVKLRLKESDRNLESAYDKIKIPNIDGRLMPLSEIADKSSAVSPASIQRENRKRIITVSANVAPGSALGTSVDDVKKLLATTLKPPAGIATEMGGENDEMEELVSNIIIAMALAIVFIYLVLASLYGSFVTPLTILVAIPFALSGAFVSLLITGKAMDLFSMIGFVMLMGLVTKNSILLVDFALNGIKQGMTRKEAIINAGQKRLRPILMTTFAMLAGTLPVALGIGEEAGGRAGMGVAIMGGVIVSTLLTLIMVPAVFEFIDKVHAFIEKKFAIEFPKEFFVEGDAPAEAIAALDADSVKEEIAHSDPPAAVTKKVARKRK